MPDSDAPRERYRQLFCEEARERVEAMELLLASGPPESAEALEALFRHAHTLKGLSVSMGFEALRERAAALEVIVARLREGGASEDPGLKASLGAQMVDLGRELDQVLQQLAGS